MLQLLEQSDARKGHCSYMLQSMLFERLACTSLVELQTPYRLFVSTVALEVGSISAPCTCS